MPYPEGTDIVKSIMHKYKAGKLRSGGRKGKPVKDNKQALAIALSEKRRYSK